MTKSCIIPNCRTGYKNVITNKYSVFKVPKHVERFQKWQAAIPGVVLKASHYVCEKHFEKKYVLREWMKKDENGRIIARSAYKFPKLDTNAVPTIFDNQELLQQSAASNDKDCKDDRINDTLGATRFAKTIDINIKGTLSSRGADVSSSESQESLVQPEINLPRELVKREVVPLQRSILKKVILVKKFVDEKTLSPMDVTECQTEAVSPKKWFVQPEIHSPGEFVKREIAPSQRSILKKVISVNNFVEKKTLSPIDANDFHTEAVSPKKSFVQPKIHLSREFSNHEIVSPRQSTISPTTVTDSESSAHDCAITVPESKTGDTNFDISTTTTIVVSTEAGKKCSIAIPKSWGVTHFSSKGKPNIVFSRFIAKQENGAEVPVVEKTLMIDSAKRLTYYIYGRIVDPESSKFTALLRDATLLPQILETFKNMNVCSGLDAANVHHFPTDDVFKDCTERWRHTQCPMISKTKRCDNCASTRRRILRREIRLMQNGSMNRVHDASNAIDQRKLLALRKKCDRERRLKNRAKRRLELLRKPLKNKVVETARAMIAKH